MLVVGGGPAGSSCARVLRQAGWQVVVLDRAVFPRDKTCAGWVTPGVFSTVGLTPEEYAASGLSITPVTRFRTGVLGRASVVDTAYASAVSYLIRRCEFDACLLERSGARVEHATVGSMARHDGMWVFDDRFRARIVIGAGGHFCPVARFLRGGHDHVQAVVAREAEYRPDGPPADDQPVEMFYCHDLEGYGWCIRKGEFLNVGLGRRRAEGLNEHVTAFAAFLEQTGRAPGATRVPWHGHAYLNDGAGARPVVGDGVLLVGDAAGLAYAESGEGIKPAVDSGTLAARVLIEESTLDAAAARYARTLALRYPRPWHTPAALAGPVTWLGRHLLQSRAFTRHVVIDRWFLRQA